MELRIDPEFVEKIPPLTDEEFQQLEANILADGISSIPYGTGNPIPSVRKMSSVSPASLTSTTRNTGVTASLHSFGWWTR